METVESDLDRLWRLQELDGELVRLHQELASHPLRQRLRERRQELEGLEAELARCRERLPALRRLVRQGELEVHSLQTEVQAFEQRLFGGSITNPKELASLEARLRQARQRLESLQERVLQQMMELEEAEQAETSLSRGADAAAQEVQDLADQWAREEARLQQALRQMQSSRQALAAAVTQPVWLSRYERLLAAKGGRALAPVESEHCSGCGVPLPTLLLEALRRRDRMVLCEVCGRILCPPRPGSGAVSSGGGH